MMWQPDSYIAKYKQHRTFFNQIPIIPKLSPK